MKNKPGQIRLIGGQFKRRIITFDDIKTLRPTPSQIRETLFNWLQQDIFNATCLDLFAGSGALGFEALSRGAKSVTFIDQHRDVIKAIQNNADLLNVRESISTRCIDVPEQPFPAPSPYHIVFIDPPYQQGFIAKTLQWLQDNALISSDSLLYIESERYAPSAWQDDCHVLKFQHKKRIEYGLYQLK